MIPAWVMLTLIAAMYGLAGVDNTIKTNTAMAIMYYGLVVVNLALAWVEYHR